MKIVKIFASIDGEVSLGGPLQWAVFVRLAGCNLRCYKSSGYCDSPHTLRMSQTCYEDLEVEQVLSIVKNFGIPRVTITGGEPLCQKDDVFQLAVWLRTLDIIVTLETNGSIEMSICDISRFNCVVMDLKTPSTEMEDRNCLVNFQRLRGCDYIKAVIQDIPDLNWMQGAFNEMFSFAAKVAIGPRMDAPEGIHCLTAAQLVEIMRHSALWNWQLNLQLHKFIYERRLKPVTSLEQVDYQDCIDKEV